MGPYETEQTYIHSKRQPSLSLHSLRECGGHNVKRERKQHRRKPNRKLSAPTKPRADGRRRNSKRSRLTRTHAHTHTHTRIHPHTHTSIHHIHTHAYIHTHTNVDTHPQRTRTHNHTHTHETTHESNK
jgi:hypothetical protein